MTNSQQRETAGRSQVRKAELIATGRKLFADTSCGALSMDDIALAIVEDCVAGLVARAGDEPALPADERVRRTVDGYLHYAEHHRAAYRTILTGGVGCDAEVLAIRDAVREEPVTAIAEGAYGRRDLPPIARLALVGWLSAVEGTTLEWISGPSAPDRPGRARLGALLVRRLRATLAVIEEFAPECPAPPPTEEPFEPAGDLAPVTGSP
ncbi:TetR/AcrR family transcriptional regulator [Streptomyces sp. NPDC056254]|uniref:TetR/AcrR family transcriptional regulator n=1 Tax=Streptomyces sp. NPDC056254 TaxID=3345763 RepID=UPI0035DD3905